MNEDEALLNIENDEESLYSNFTIIQGDIIVDSSQSNNNFR